MITLIIIWLVVLTLVCGLIIHTMRQNKKSIDDLVDNLIDKSNRDDEQINKNTQSTVNKFKWIEKVMAHKNPRLSDPEYKPLEEKNATKINKH